MGQFPMRERPIPFEFRKVPGATSVGIKYISKADNNEDQNEMSPTVQSTPKFSAKPVWNPELPIQRRSISIHFREVKAPPRIRPCDIYKEEYSDCTSIKARFHQYFIHGEMVDCSQWKKDFNNCSKWTLDQNIDAMQDLVLSEQDRRRKRFQAHNNNTVWQKRAQPPADWNKPLPDWLENKYKDTYLYHKSKEMKLGEDNKSPQADRTLCVIS
uniref:Synaptic plasticity regulator PANTS n=1 Tax=Timema poppense TaxID=170557 RepID=A0A7R9DCF8_TIMPO|nr:unnamed protein product [Timema poppensis]